jgi:hypothetical protein
MPTENITIGRTYRHDAMDVIYSAFKEIQRTNYYARAK